MQNTRSMIAIIDYGMGNAPSIANMIRKVGGHCIITPNPQDAMQAEILILPGVGAFDNAVRQLRDKGWLEVILNHVYQSRKLIGICLGMQLLFETSQEGVLPGLGLIKGKVQRFEFDQTKIATLKIPHMGWNTIDFTHRHYLSAGYSEQPRFYFVHSYHAVCDQGADIVAITNYGYPFPAVVEHKNVLGVQFHPEKSHVFGLQFFKNVLEQ